MIKAFLYKNFERALWLAVVVTLLLLFKQCNNQQGAQLAAIKQRSAALQAKHESDSIAFAAQVARWKDSIRNAGINSELQVKVIKETEKKLAASQSSINRLTAIIRNAPEIPDSSKGVFVSKDYKAACDSLPGEIDKQNAVLAEKDTAINDLIGLMNYEIAYRDSLIEAGKDHIGRLNSSFAAQHKLFDEVMKAGKPRGRLLGGIGLIGNETNTLSGTKINLAYQSRNGEQYQVGGLLMRGGLYYEAGILITLIK